MMASWDSLRQEIDQAVESAASSLTLSKSGGNWSTIDPRLDGLVGEQSKQAKEMQVLHNVCNSLVNRNEELEKQLFQLKSYMDAFQHRLLLSTDHPALIYLKKMMPRQEAKDVKCKYNKEMNMVFKDSITLCEKVKQLTMANWLLTEEQELEVNVYFQKVLILWNYIRDMRNDKPLPADYSATVTPKDREFAMSKIGKDMEQEYPVNFIHPQENPGKVAYEAKLAAKGIPSDDLMVIENARSLMKDIAKNPDLVWKHQCIALGLESYKELQEYYAKLNETEHGKHVCPAIDEECK